MSYFHSHRHMSEMRPQFRSGNSAQSYASVVGILEQATERPIQGRSGDHLQFYLSVGNGARYQVDVNTQSEDGSDIEVYIAEQSLSPAGSNPDEPFGAPAYGVFPDAALSYRAIGLADTDFAQMQVVRIEDQLEADLNAAHFVAVYGMVFDDGGSDGKGIHKTHFTGVSEKDGALALYRLDAKTGNPMRTWYFFKFAQDDIAGKSA